MEELLDSLSLLTVEEKLSHWRSSKKRGKSVPTEIKQQVVGLLKENTFGHLQKRLGLSVKTLKSWQAEYSSGQVFIALPPVNEKPAGKLDLKFSRSNSGTWTVEGSLNLKDWQSAIRLLEGVR
jgi:hypothetical protein